MDVKNLMTEKKLLENSITTALDDLVLAFNARTGVHIDSISVDMISAHCMGEEPKYYVGGTHVRIVI